MMDQMMGKEDPMAAAPMEDPMQAGLDPLAGEMAQRELFLGEKGEQLDPYTISKIMEMLQQLMAQGQMPMGDMSGGLPPVDVPPAEDPMAGGMPADPMADPLMGAMMGREQPPMGM
jgi:hypothetical protein